MRSPLYYPVILNIKKGLRTESSNNLSFGHFLERKDAFLESIGQKEVSLHSRKTQTKLMEILQDSKNFKPLQQLDIQNIFGSNNDYHHTRDLITIRQMMNCSMHLGHSTSRWNPKMAPFIYGERAGIHIIDLEKTLVCLRQACNVTMDISSRDGSIVFVGTGESIQRLTYECAQECHQFYVNTRWIGGTITNRVQVLRSDKLKPDLLIILDPINNEKAVLEAQIGGIPTIAICDTNFNPNLITYPIPANDDAYSAIEIVAKTLSMAALAGKQIQVKNKPLKSLEIIESATNFIDTVFRRT